MSRLLHMLVLLLVFLTLSVSLGPGLAQEDLVSSTNGSVSGKHGEDPYNCGPNKPCFNGACCGRVGYCGFGPEYCGTTGKSPNDVCWSNCDAHADAYGFCGTTAEFCGKGCQSGCSKPMSKASNSSSQKRVLGYYESWMNDRQCMGMRISQIPVESLTHLYYAFGYITPATFEVTLMPDINPNTLLDFAKLKERNPSVVLRISLGGWDFNEDNTLTQNVFADMVSTEANRAKFIQHLRVFMRQHSLDAVDIDWEYPGAPDRQPNHKDCKKDGANYVSLMKELREAADSSLKKFTISFTAPTSYWYLRWFDIGPMVDAADFVTFMTYDLHGIWDQDSTIGKRVLAHTNLTEITEALDLLWRNGVPAAKVNLGLAFYARTYTLTERNCIMPGCPFEGGGEAGPCTKQSGILSYSEIANLLATQDVTPVYDKEAAVKWIVWGSKNWASYDDHQTLQDKIHYADKHGLGGLAIWAIDQDDRSWNALRAVLYPRDLGSQKTLGGHVAYWERRVAATCETTHCGGSCPAGYIELTTLKCVEDDERLQRVCCPIESTPDPKTCTWRGTPSFCNGQCHGGEVALASRGRPYCKDGRQFYCCPIPESAGDNAGINCNWQSEKCREDQTLMTFAGTFLGELEQLVPALYLVGIPLSVALEGLDITLRRHYCCGIKEAQNWKDCYWAGTPGKGVHSCDDNHCATGIEVQLTNHKYGAGQSCAITLRDRAFCCTPVSGQSLFLPVPLENLFPHLPPSNEAEPIFRLQIDGSWGTGQDQGEHNHPNNASFGFVIITAPKEVHGEQTVKMVCTNLTDHSRCNDIYLGDGVPGTILQMPAGCGPGKYAAPVYDLTFDYDFRRVPRGYGPSQMRLDFSNEEGYWDAVVSRPASPKKSEPELEEYRQNRKRWLEDEWRDAYHHGGLSHTEIHRRWFASDALKWLITLVGVGEAELNKKFNHKVKEMVRVVLFDGSATCPVGSATAYANLRASVESSIDIETSFGITIIVNLAQPLDLSNSYLYFRNRGKVWTHFRLDADASLHWNSGDVKLLGLDDFPGATFTVPGIVTVGPNLEMYASVHAGVTFSGSFKAQVNLAEWDVEQTYPYDGKLGPKEISETKTDGTRMIGEPRMEASAGASGEFSLNLKPRVNFGVVFDDRWKVPSCSVQLNLEESIIFHAQAGWSSNSEAQGSCLSSYGIDAALRIYAALDAPDVFNWGGERGGQRHFPLFSRPRKEIYASKCASASISIDSTDLMEYNVNNAVVLYSPPVPSWLALARSHSRFADYGDQVSAREPASLHKRQQITIGPILSLPGGLLSCPAAGNVTGCVSCIVSTAAESSLELAGRGDENICPWHPPRGTECTGTSVITISSLEWKKMPLSWAIHPITGRPEIDLARYPTCSAGDLDSLSKVSKWWMVGDRKSSSCDPAIRKVSKDSSTPTVQGVPIFRNFATDHVFDVHLLSNFLEWVCDTDKDLNYHGQGKMTWLKGWQRPDAVWCQHVFGPDTITGGFDFKLDPKDDKPSNLLANIATKVGGTEHPEWLAILAEMTNNDKATWLQGQRPSIPHPTEAATVHASNVQRHAAVSDYLHSAKIKDAWMQPSNGIEAVCAAFDQAFWGSPFAKNAIGVKLERPPAPDKVTTWGLRTLWCLWIDDHLYRVEAVVGPWLAKSREELQKKTDASSNLAINFLTAYMSPQGLASADRMRLPRVPFSKGTRPPIAGWGSENSELSQYGMWGSNGLGPLGV
ncbi:uncharacterized protein BO66DRAFT_436148 [Aspergillus aculeatinus CBS 121060]|uniref:Uncharacterized protein n=1 Tax=Aspergillus aculeatinus CBS 121060 TaxID=1448322 RepID=A0ACD1HG82_9EURO|nr:hypothetical protein BO66DRAFT_436148 [Aspergillus aculeatinus CBS 121060]RAH72481.1 hypothetical protein BO66DRAFT_436148 [Aspergillus aculeatinus CBS 121060]